MLSPWLAVSAQTGAHVISLPELRHSWQHILTTSVFPTLPSCVCFCIRIAGSGATQPHLARKLLQKKYQVSSDPDNRDCYLYRAVTGDSLEAIAKATGVSESDLRDRNSKNIADFSRLNGRFLQICNIKGECSWLLSVGESGGRAGWLGACRGGEVGGGR